MPLYSYIAKSLKGEEKTGAAEAKDERQLARTLKEEGFILVRAEIGGKKPEKRNLSFSLPFLGGISLTEKMMFTRNLQVMVSAGLPFPRALETLSLQTQNKKFKSALLKIKDEVIKGKNFSEALAEFPGIFSELFQNMVKVGEESGTLDNVLKILARQMDREHQLKAKITGAMMYPAVIILAMLGIGVLMLITVVPKLAQTFQELNVELPLTTQLVISIGTFFAQNLFLLVLVILAVFFLFWLLLKTTRFKTMVDALSLKLPVVSALIKKTNSASTVGTLSSLIASGVPIVRSLEIVSGTLGNVYYKKAILDAVEKVRKGEKLSAALAPYQNIYPLIVCQMIQIGEETGETAAVLSKLAEFFEEEVANSTENLVSIIEPVLMLVIGGVVGFFAISMVQPMYSMLGSV